MKRIGISSAAVLSLVLGMSGLVHAQHDDRGDRHESQQDGHEQNRPEQQRGHAQGQPERDQQQQRDQQSHDRQAQQQAQQNQQRNQAQQQSQRNQQQVQAQQAQRSQQQAQRRQQPYPQHQAQSNMQQRNRQQAVRQSAWQQHRSQNWESDHRTWQQRGGYHGYRIPRARYRGYFGPSHQFRINTLPFRVVGGYPRFQYQGYWISAVDPWPQAWGDNWYDNDDVYVNYVDNGYYLYNRRYPSSGIAINITL
jgi:hypothetical protein